MSTEIFNNTLLKILFRQGTDNDRKNIILNSGEPGFTTDTNRLFVGDGVTTGGSLVGNKFLGSVTDITSVAPGEIGDTVYNTDTAILYRLKTNDGSNIGDWEAISGRGIDSNTVQSISGIRIDNLVRINKTDWFLLSATADSNTFYIVSNNNYITM